MFGIGKRAKTKTPLPLRKLRLSAARKGVIKKPKGQWRRDCSITVAAFLLPLIVFEMVHPMEDWWAQLPLPLPPPANATTQVLLSTSSSLDPKGPAKAAKPRESVPRMDAPADQTIAYVVPLVSNCGRLENPNLRDAAMVLRHSIHLQSARTPSSGSPFGYNMYALIPQGKNCPQSDLEELGYRVHSVQSPVKLEDIQNAIVRSGLEKGNSDGGVDSYIQLLAHQVVEKEPIVVLLHINTVLLKPLDDLFLAMLFSKGTPPGDAARAKIVSQLERPGDPMPDRIHHFFVRDYPHTAHARKPVVLAPGFLVARTDPALIPQAVQLIQAADSYVEGTSPTSGWGGKGYSLYFSGGMTFPGFYAYFIDEFHADTSVELNGCTFNHNGMDNKFRKPPRFHPSADKNTIGKCRSGEESCRDCTTTEVDAGIYSIHFDMTCFHPWKCYGDGAAGGKARTRIDTQITPVEHCMKLQHEWHNIRKIIELQIATATQNSVVTSEPLGSYKKEIFFGHCRAHGEYLTFAAPQYTTREIAGILWAGK